MPPPDPKAKGPPWQAAPVSQNSLPCSGDLPKRSRNFKHDLCCRRYSLCALSRSHRRPARLGRAAAMKNASETLVCQINAIADFVCQSSLERDELRALAKELHAQPGEPRR